MNQPACYAANFPFNRVQRIAAKRSDGDFASDMPVQLEAEVAAEVR